MGMSVPYKIVKEIPPDLGTLYCDTETIGLYGEIRLLQVYSTQLKEVLLIEWPDPIYLKELIESNDTVWQNSHYDLSAIGNKLPEPISTCRVFDTFLAARLHFFKKDGFSLDKVFTYVLGYDPYEREGLDKKLLQKSEWDVTVLTSDQLLYAAIDVYYLPQVHEQVQHQADSFSYQLDMHTVTHCLDFQRNGMPVNQDLALAKRQEIERKIEEIALPINANSPKQVTKWLDIPSSPAYELKLLELRGNTRARDVILVRKLSKQISFLNKFTGSAIYGYFKPSARSGRLTCDRQNLQQIPYTLKGIFEPPEGEVFIYSDYAQLELRCACVITAERKMEELMRAGGDLHGYTAEMLFGPDYTKLDREVAKQCNFNLLFGGGAGMLRKILVMKADLLLPEHKVQEYRRRWLNIYHTIAKWQNRGISDHRANIHHQTPLGRRYMGARITDHLNIEVQGFGAEVAKLALHYMKPKLPDSAKIRNFIHDAYIPTTPNDPAIYKPVAKLVADSMQKAWREACQGVAIKDLPMPVEVKVGTNWGDLEAGKNLIWRLEQ